jgi:integrase
METSTLPTDVAKPLPPLGPIPLGENSSSLISTAVQEGVSAALERLGIRDSILPSEQNPGCPVTREDIITNWTYPHNPQGARTKLKPWTTDGTDKRTAQAIVIMKVPAGLFEERMRARGKNREECLKNGRKMMIDALDRKEGLDSMDVKDRLQFIAEVKTLTKAGLPAESIWDVIADGKRVHLARKEFNIPLKIDVVGLGIKWACLAILTFQDVVDKYTATFKDLIDPTRKGQVSHSNDRAIYKRLVMFIKTKTEEQNGDSSVLRVMEETTLVEDFFKTEIHGKVGKPSTNGRYWTGLVNLFEYAESKLHLPKLHARIYGPQPKAERKTIKAPKADILERFLNLILEKDPRYIPMAVLCIWCTRPEEAYEALANLPLYLRETWIHIPLEISKGNSVNSKNIRLIPAALFWLAKDRRWLDPKATDFRPLHANGKPLAYGTVEQRLNKFLREAGWEGGVKESLRKAKISGQWALEVPENLIVQEAGHADNTMIHSRYIDKSWSMANGRAVDEIFPPGTHNPPTKNLHQAYRQELELTDEILPAYVIRPQI